MLQSFKMWVTYNFFFNFTPENCARCEAAFVGRNLIFLLHVSPMSGANIQAWTNFS